MLRKYALLLGIALALLLLLVATWVYPGGSVADQHSVGFDWSRNFISNLFAARAVNGAANPARFWSVAGMLLLSASMARFFIDFSRKIPDKGAARVIKYCGAICMVFTFLIATPLHDVMVIIASTLFLLGIFYITVFVFKSRLHVFKFLCVACLLVFYATLYLYGAREYRGILPLMQKLTVAVSLLLVLGLEYFTHARDFQPASAGQPDAGGPTATLL
ncbi:hypothetical protein [Hymenobacter sp. B81]|uniref:hypothetical protein n=1 Tax=Hymenobacter sp. B81 TaxID=3344878 RepID=UPI0037DCD371